MGIYVKSVVHGPINEADPRGWTYADKKANRALEQLQSKGAEVLGVKIQVERRERFSAGWFGSTAGWFGSIVIYQITYKAAKPIEVDEAQESK